MLTVTDRGESSRIPSRKNDNAMYEQLFMLWMPLVLVVVLEHFILTRRYDKPSSLQRILANGNSAKADAVVWFIFYVAMPYVQSIVSVLTVPGLAYLAMNSLGTSMGWPSLFGRWMPRDPIAIFVVWLLAVDFAIYVAHVLMHKVPWLWHLHRLHHSATEFNIITGIRITLGERFFNDLMILLSLALVLGLPSPQQIFTVMFVYNIIDLLQHSDLPWDYGVFGYAIASPRYHRMHHSVHPEDSDANYGNIFSFWDYLFGTVARRYRQSTHTADGCVLGLQNQDETASINDCWYLAPLQATGVDYAFFWLRRNGKLAPRIARGFLGWEQIQTNLVPDLRTDLRGPGLDREAST